VVGLNFGCGSSREHAPEALKRWGIRGIVGGSFAEIFFGNSTALGIPCLTVAPQDVEWLMGAVAHHPEREIVLDVDAQGVRLGDRTIPARLPDAARKQLLTGTWTATAVLLEAGEEIERVAKGLPYLRGY
jgi:3-isopropylmalate/(R)-2-methylmalate dehydratase small subunit